MLPEEIGTRFNHHAPTGDKISRHETTRARVRALAHLINEDLPDCYEKDNTIKALEEALMWANAGIARR